MGGKFCPPFVWINCKNMDDCNTCDNDGYSPCLCNCLKSHVDDCAYCVLHCSVDKNNFQFKNSKNSKNPKNNFIYIIILLFIIFIILFQFR